jgi:hypothetical protein
VTVAAVWGEGIARRHRVGGFVREALSSDPAQRPEWQPSRRWDETVAARTGLGAVPPASAAPPDAVTTRYLRRHLPYYEALHARRLTAS